MRIYGNDPGAPNTETPGHRYAALIGGPLDGAALITELGTYGPGGRAHYEGQPGDPDRLHWVGDTA